jgi:hypothetical protein
VQKCIGESTLEVGDFAFCARSLKKSPRQRGSGWSVLGRHAISRVRVAVGSVIDLVSRGKKAFPLAAAWSKRLLKISPNDIFSAEAG